MAGNNWPDKAPESQLFDRINPHISEYTDDIAIKNICAEFQQESDRLREQIEELKEADAMLTEIARVLDDVSYTGSYADGVRQLRARVAELEQALNRINLILQSCTIYSAPEKFRERVMRALSIGASLSQEPE